MDFKQKHLQDWIQSHLCLSFTCVEENCYLQKNFLNDFLNSRENILEVEYQKLCDFLYNYGYTPLETE